MLSRNLFRWMHRVALFAIVFASLAPSISHALATQNDGTQGFMQAICGVGGQKLYIQVVTTKGQSIQAALDTEPGSQPVSINHQLNHCPFCNAGVANVAIPSHSPSFEFYLAQLLSEQQPIYDVPSLSTVIHSAHLSRGPPVISL